MNYFLIVFAAIILCCIILNKWSTKFGLPVLLAFIMLGMLMGWHDVVDRSSYTRVSNICNVALIFIIFYGGFGTRWKSARPVAGEAAILATLGVIVTAALTCVFCYFVLKMPLLRAMLIGAVLSSTDAASVFSILRARKLGLKHNVAPLLEMESGSNDPCAYMLTVIVLSLVNSPESISVWNTIWLFFKQMFFGIGVGALVAWGAVRILKKFSFETSGFDSLFILAVALLAYTLPSLIDGNGFLSVYIVGIVLGNTSYSGRKQLVNFFDGITGLMQVILFYILGYLSTPSQLYKSLLPALGILIFMTFIARPATIFSLLGFVRKDGKRKYDSKDMGLVSFVGLRGAASIVFVATALASNELLLNETFDIIFIIVLLSIGIQGSLIPFVSRKLDMIDKDSDVMTTFTDFADNSEMQFSRIDITSNGAWKGKAIKDLGLPSNLILVMIIRNGERLLPKGGTVLEEGDIVIAGTRTFEDFSNQFVLREHRIDNNNPHVGHMISEFPNTKEVIVMIKRGDKNIIPSGRTVMKPDDILVIMSDAISL